MVCEDSGSNEVIIGIWIIPVRGSLTSSCEESANRENPDVSFISPKAGSFEGGRRVEGKANQRKVRLRAASREPDFRLDRELTAEKASEGKF